MAASLLALGLGLLPAAGCGRDGRQTTRVPAASAPAARRPAAPAAAWRLRLVLSPASPAVGRPVQFTLTVTGSNGHPVTRAQVRLELTMVSMDMGTIRVPLREATPGRYAGRGAFPMGGDWNCRVVVRRGGQTHAQVFPCRAG